MAIAFMTISTELKLLTIDFVDYHSLRSLRSTCQTFCMLITPDMLARRKELQRQELDVHQWQLLKAFSHAVQSKSIPPELAETITDIDPEPVPIFLYDRVASLSIGGGLQLPCYKCLSLKPVTNFNDLFCRYENFHRQPVRDLHCNDCRLEPKQHIPKCAYCGSIGSCVMSQSSLDDILAVNGETPPPSIIKNFNFRRYLPLRPLVPNTGVDMGIMTEEDTALLLLCEPCWRYEDDLFEYDFTHNWDLIRY